MGDVVSWFSFINTRKSTEISFGFNVLAEKRTIAEELKIYTCWNASLHWCHEKFIRMLILE